jgi:hypothetical protein
MTSPPEDKSGDRRQMALIDKNNTATFALILFP